MFSPGQKVLCVKGNTDVCTNEVYEVESEDGGGLVCIKGIGGCFSERFVAFSELEQQDTVETVFGTFPFLNPGKGRV